MSVRILKGPEIRLFAEEKTLGQFFFNSAVKHKDRMCQIDGEVDKTEDYDSIKRRSTRVAISLQNRGITSNDLIAFCSKNTIDNTIPILAAFYIGAKVSSLVPTLSVEYTKHLLSIITPKMIFVDEASIFLIEESLEDANFQTEIVVFGRSTKYPAFSDFVKSKDTEKKFKPVNVDPDDVALVIFTSGVTGMPKIISHSHRSFLNGIIPTFNEEAGLSMLHFNSFYGISAYVALAYCFKWGSYRVFMRDSNPAEICSIIEKYMVSFLWASYMVINNFVGFKDSKKYDTSSLKMVVYRGSSISVSHLQNLSTVFPSAIVTMFYGMVETGMIANFDIKTHRDLMKTRLSSCGKASAGIELKVINVNTGNILGPNEKGEIRVKSKSMMVGYYKGDFSQVFDEEDFFKTRDIGYYDKDDCIYVTERLAETFRYKRDSIIPSTIEAVLLLHPAISQAVVFGLKQGDEEVPAACIVLRKGYALTAEEIDAFLKEKVSDSERLRGGITFRSFLPTTPTEKISRQEVKDLVIKSKKK